MRTKNEIQNDYIGYSDSAKESKIIVELLFDIRDAITAPKPPQWKKEERERVIGIINSKK